MSLRVGPRRRSGTCVWMLCLLASLSGCELVAEFDRDKIPIETPDGGGGDGDGDSGDGDVGDAGDGDADDQDAGVDDADAGEDDEDAG